MGQLQDKEVALGSWSRSYDWFQTHGSRTQFLTYQVSSRPGIMKPPLGNEAGFQQAPISHPDHGNVLASAPIQTPSPVTDFCSSMFSISDFAMPLWCSQAWILGSHPLLQISQLWVNVLQDYGIPWTLYFLCICILARKLPEQRTNSSPLYSVQQSMRQKWKDHEHRSQLSC